MIEEEFPQPELTTPGAIVPREERDLHNTPRIRFEIQAREGGRCANPHCRRELSGCGQVHHLKPWSEGGRTAPWNLTAVYGRCHALAHQGLLTITGDPIRGLEWKVACEGSTQSIRAAFDQSLKDPRVRVVKLVEAAVSSDDLSGPPAEPAATARKALEALGWKARQAKELIARAWKCLLAAATAPESIDASELVREASRIGTICTG